MDDIQERLEHYEAKDRERQEREAEIMRLDLMLFVYARNHDTINEDYSRKYVMRNAMILDYGNTYGTKAQERLREMLDVAREKLLARMKEFEEEAESESAQVIKRPFTLREFMRKFPILKMVTMRRKDKPKIIKNLVFCGWEELPSGDYFLTLGSGEFSSKFLFEYFEYKDNNGDWQPFGFEE